MLFEHACKQCGKVKFFFPSELNDRRTGPRMYCSNVCRAEFNSVWERAGCRWCGGNLNRRYNKFCSHKCRGEYQKSMKIPKGAKVGSDAVRKDRDGNNHKAV